MGRVLTAEWQRVSPADRPRAERAWRDRRAVLAAHGAHHWLFVSATDPDAYLEFTEAADPDALRRAHAEAGLGSDLPILYEVELS